MPDRAELVEAALDVYPEGLALVDAGGRILVWNPAAERLTGYAGAQVVGRALPGEMEALKTSSSADEGSAHPRGVLVYVKHMRGHDVPMIARRVALRDGLGTRIGTAVSFHAADATQLPKGEAGEDSLVRASQSEMRKRLEADFEAFVEEEIPLGVLWMVVDQAADLRKTHGAQACELMLEAMERTLANALRAGEEIGRWGNDEFLVLCHEASDDLLASHAQVLAGIARTADFRWWGDRASLTVSMGAAAAQHGESLPELLQRARDAMQESGSEGGNRVSFARGRHACSPS